MLFSGCGALQASDISEEQQKHAVPHAQVQYWHTPLSNVWWSTSRHNWWWKFCWSSNSCCSFAVVWSWKILSYCQTHFWKASRTVLAVWGFSINTIQVNLEFDSQLCKVFWNNFYFSKPKTQVFNWLLQDTSISIWKCWCRLWGAVTGIGHAAVDVRSFSPVNTAKRQSVDLLSEEVVKELEGAWDGTDLVRTIN